MLGRLKESSVKHEGWVTSADRKSSFTYNSKGSLETETIEKGNQALTSTKTYVYDKFGNRFKCHWWKVCQRCCYGGFSVYV